MALGGAIYRYVSVPTVVVTACFGIELNVHRVQPYVFFLASLLCGYT